MILYNLVVTSQELLIKLFGHINSKAKLWSDGRKGLLKRIESNIKPEDRIFWIHCASVGEFEQGRPIIEYVKDNHPEFKVLITFYSPSGYELRKSYPKADYIFYFPSDRPPIAKKFIKAIHPEIAVFVKYEFWLNTLKELRNNGIKTYLICSVFRKDSVFFKSYGECWRKGLETYSTLFVQDENSKHLLSEIGINSVIVAGDTRFDRVYEITKSTKRIEIVEQFIDDKRVFVAGSTWGPDEEILIRLINDNPEVKFIIAPHEMDNGRIQKIINSVNGGAVRYTDPGENLTNSQVLIVDTIGLLSIIYRYASWVYIGGGFGVGIHNTVEAASYGIPLSFGPNYHKFNEAIAMIELGVAKSVNNYDELKSWFIPIKENEDKRLQICSAARQYTDSQLGATQTILDVLGL